MDSITSLVATIQTWLDILGPNPWLRAAVIIVVALVVAFVVERMIVATIGRLVSRTTTVLDDELIERSRRPVFMTIFVAGLVIATRQLELSASLTDVTISALQTILIFVWLGFGLRFFSIVLQALSRMREKYEFIQPSTLPLFDNSAKIVVGAAGIYLAFLAWNIDVTALIASAGIVGLALSFAAQDTLANIFGGMSILADRPYKVGDFINLDSGERGEVTQIGLRSTRLLTRDDVEVSIPNAVMGNAKIVNEAGGPHEKFRVRIAVGVAYGSDIDQVEGLLLEIAKNHDEVCSTPAPRVRLRGFGDSSLDFELLAWVARPVLRGRICHELNCAVYKTFVTHNVEIPFPQQDIHIRDVAAAAQPSSG